MIPTEVGTSCDNVMRVGLSPAGGRLIFFRGFPISFTPPAGGMPLPANMIE
jgi:hypothetical protein